MRRIASALVACCAATYATAEVQPEISMDEVPALVLETARATAPGVEFERVSVEEENGVLIYEFEATSFDGQHVEIDVREDGTLEEIELQKSASEVPEDVFAALESAVPGAEPFYIEASIRDGFFVYEFECDVDGVFVDVEIDETGAVLSIDRGDLS